MSISVSSSSHYIENVELQRFTSLLTSYNLGSLILNGRAEAYCLTYGDEINSNTFVFPSTSSGNSSGNNSPRPRAYSTISHSQYSLKRNSKKRSSSMGDLDEPSTQQLFLNLISTMNEAFPDYDFAATKLDQFIEKDVFGAMRVVNSYLAEMTELDRNFLEDLWKAIDEVVFLRKCVVFSYAPGADEEDPFHNNSLWSFNFFFFNDHLKRICYITCSGTRYVPWLLYT